jgi:hypothetical protein
MAKIKTRNSDTHKTKPKNIHHRSFEKVYWPYIPIVLAISFLLSIGFQGGNLQAYVRHPGGRVLSYSTSMSIGGLLADTNSARASNGVASLGLNDKLDAAAQAKADDMAARNYWSHYTPEGNPPWVFVTNQGYSYQKLGENLATGFSDEQATINGWMASPPHRENLLNGSFTEVGFGYANNPNYTAAGGGPMTIIVAFYGQPQVLAANTTAPAPPAPAQSPPANQPAAQAPAAENPAPSQATPTATSSPAAQTPKKQPATTQTPKATLTPAVKSSRLQLVFGNSSATGAITAISIAAAAGLALWWVRRHALAVHKFLLKGERYAIRHPLTDIGLLVIACLLFMLSQTAGLTL